MKYREFSAYWVMDEVKKGERVYVLDRQTKTVEVVNEMTVDKAMAVINSAEADSKRYEFWTEKEETENA
jgi:hypothetical protein